MSHLIGQVAVGCMADLVLWQPGHFGAKPEMIVKGGVIAWATVSLLEKPCWKRREPKDDHFPEPDGRSQRFDPDSPAHLWSTHVGRRTLVKGSFSSLDQSSIH